MIASQLSGHCDIISNRLWHHQQNENKASKTLGWYVKVVILLSFMNSLWYVRNKMMYVLSWQNVSALTRVLFWLCSSVYKHQNNPLESSETVRHSSTYIVLYIYKISRNRFQDIKSCTGYGFHMVILYLVNICSSVAKTCKLSKTG